MKLDVSSKSAVVAAATIVLSLVSAEPAGAAPDVFDRLQENVWYLSTKDHEAKLYVTSIGSGPPVVFLHGGPGDDFNYAIDALRPHLGDHRFILFDQRGSLLSPVAPDKIATLTLDKLVDDIETLRLALGENKLVIFGHSFGTLLAQAYLLKHPDHVAGLVLAAAFFPTTDVLASLKPVSARQDAMMARPVIHDVLVKEGLDRPDAKLSPQQSSEKWRISRFAANNIVHVERWREVQGGQVYYNDKIDDAVGNSLPKSIDVSSILAARRTPVTVLDGDSDYLDPSAAGWRALADKGLVKTFVLPHAGHDGWVDAPEEFATAVRVGLQRADAGR